VREARCLPSTSLAASVVAFAAPGFRGKGGLAVGFDASRARSRCSNLRKRPCASIEHGTEVALFLPELQAPRSPERCSFSGRWHRLRGRRAVSWFSASDAQAWARLVCGARPHR